MKRSLSKGTLLSAKVIALFLVLFSCFGYSQTVQKSLWSVPDQYIKFTTTPSLFELPENVSWYYSDVPALNAHNAIHDVNGNLQFFITDDNNDPATTGQVYDKTGKLIGRIADLNGNTCTNSAEIAIVAVPGQCQKFYIISSRGKVVTTSGYISLFYSIVDLSQINSTTGAQGVLLDIDPNDGLNCNTQTLLTDSPNASHPAVVSMV